MTDLPPLNLAPLKVWQRGEFWYLAGTYVELWREYGSGYWFVVDGRNPDVRLCGDGALPLATAKDAASRYVKVHPELLK